MRAKFGRGQTVVSKKGSLKFISRFVLSYVANGLNKVFLIPEIGVKGSNVKGNDDDNNNNRV